MEKSRFDDGTRKSGGICTAHPTFTAGFGTKSKLPPLRRLHSVGPDVTGERVLPVDTWKRATDFQKPVECNQRAQSQLMHHDSLRRGTEHDLRCKSRVNAEARTFASRRDEPGSIPGGGTSRVFARGGNHAERRRWLAGFLGDLPFSHFLRSGAAPCSPHFKTPSLGAAHTSTSIRVHFVCPKADRLIPFVPPRQRQRQGASCDAGEETAGVTKVEVYAAGPAYYAGGVGAIVGNIFGSLLGVLVLLGLFYLVFVVYGDKPKVRSDREWIIYLRISAGMRPVKYATSELLLVSCRTKRFVDEADVLQSWRVSSTPDDGYICVLDRSYCLRGGGKHLDPLSIQADPHAFPPSYLGRETQRLYGMRKDILGSRALGATRHWGEISGRSPTTPTERSLLRRETSMKTTDDDGRRLKASVFESAQRTLEHCGLVGPGLNDIKRWSLQHMGYYDTVFTPECTTLHFTGLSGCLVYVLSVPQHMLHSENRATDNQYGTILCNMRLLTWLQSGYMVMAASCTCALLRIFGQRH
ncbi:hypothetical protein PR048_010526 [Dryococelus australis]|uniref:Uncharacterized protein n=1 Tax=Dryococelus australis TaxID=614101 RepID=A0ABQ9I2Y9_9NEOP|nr:hypothetical protein PR048_010526 [Dryococelus australis]